MIDYMTLGEFIAGERYRLKLSLQDVANVTGFSKAHIWDLERGSSINPTMKTVQALSKCFDRNPDMVFHCALESLAQSRRVSLSDI